MQLNPQEKRVSLRNSIRKKSSFMRRSTISKHSHLLENVTSSNIDSFIKEDTLQQIEVPKSIETLKSKCFKILSLLNQLDSVPITLQEPIRLLIEWRLPQFILDCFERVILIFDYEFFEILCKLQTIFFSFTSSVSLEHVKVLGKFTFQEVLGKFIFQGRFLWNNFRLALERISPPFLFECDSRSSSFAHRLTEFCFAQLEVHFTKQVRNQTKNDLMERKTTFIDKHENQFFNLAQLLLVLVLLFTKESSTSQLRYF
jgi:hypothetical protein